MEAEIIVLIETMSLWVSAIPQALDKQPYCLCDPLFLGPQKHFWSKDTLSFAGQELMTWSVAKYTPKKEALPLQGFFFFFWEPKPRDRAYLKMILDA